MTEKQAVERIQRTLETFVRSERRRIGDTRRRPDAVSWAHAQRLFLEKAWNCVGPIAMGVRIEFHNHIDAMQFLDLPKRKRRVRKKGDRR